MTTKNITVRNATITAATFTTNLKAVKSAADKLGLLLEASGKQATFYGNMDWLNRLFGDDSPLIKVDGELSVLGKTARAFIVYHVPAIKVEKNAQGVFKASFTKNKKRRASVVTGIDDDGAPVFSDDATSDFQFDFKEWQARAKPKKANDGMTATKATKAVERATTAMDNLMEEWAEIDGKTDDFHALAAMASKLQAAADQLNRAAKARVATRVSDAFQMENAPDMTHATEGAVAATGPASATA